jgi:biotin carboxylase
MKNILVIGGGWEQAELVRTVKNNGFRAIVTHPALDVEVNNMAHRYFIRAADDIKSHLSLAAAYDVVGVISDNCDYSLHTASLVASRVGLPSVGINAATCGINKSRQRLKCEKARVEQPTYYTFNTLHEYMEGARGLEYPLVVKPNDSRGTFGVTIIHNSQELEEAYFHALCHSPSKTGIIEAFIGGTLFTVDGFCFNNGHCSLAVASRQYTPGPYPVTTEIVYPAEVSQELGESLLFTHHDTVTHLGYHRGHTHGEYIVDKWGDIYLVECANRGGGVYTSSTIVPTITGINLNQAILNQALGEEVNFTEQTCLPAILAFLELSRGKVLKSLNIEELLELPSVLKLRSLYKAKDMIESIDNCASRHIMVALQGDRKQLQEFKQQLKAEYY